MWNSETSLFYVFGELSAKCWIWKYWLHTVEKIKKVFFWKLPLFNLYILGQYSLQSVTVLRPYVAVSGTFPGFGFVFWCDRQVTFPRLRKRDSCRQNDKVIVVPQNVKKQGKLQFRFGERRWSYLLYLIWVFTLHFLKFEGFQTNLRTFFQFLMHWNWHDRYLEFLQPCNVLISNVKTMVTLAECTSRARRRYFCADERFERRAPCCDLSRDWSCTMDRACWCPCPLEQVLHQLKNDTDATNSSQLKNVVKCYGNSLYDTRDCAAQHYSSKYAFSRINRRMKFGIFQVLNRERTILLEKHIIGDVDIRFCTIRKFGLGVDGCEYKVNIARCTVVMNNASEQHTFQSLSCKVLFSRCVGLELNTG